MKSFRSTLVFALVVAAVVGYAVFEMKRGEKNEAAEAKEDRLFSWEEKDIQEISLRHDDGGLVIVREGDNWRLKEPVSDRTDDFMVTSFLSSILSQVAKVVEENNQSWADYGLENSTTKVELVGPGGERKAIEVSQEKAYDDSHFIRQGDRLLVGSSDWAKLGKKKANEVREKKFFHSDKKIVAFRIQVPKEKIDITLESKGDEWKSSQYPDVVIAKSEVDKFTLDSSTFKSLDFVAEETEPKILAHFGLDKPDLIISYWLEGAEGEGPHWWMKVKRAASGTEGFAYHSERQTIYKVHEDTVKRYAKSLGDFRDKKLPFKFQPDAVQELTLKTRLTDLKLDKKDGRWIVANPPAGKEVDQEKVKGLIDRLSELEAKYFLGAKKGKGLKPPVNSVVLRNQEGEELLSMSWGTSFKAKQELATDSDEELYYVKTSRVADTLGVVVSKLDELPGQTLLKDIPKEEPKKPEGGAAMSRPMTPEPEGSQ
ncbi:MAG: DUF4340 domain-containing protein [Bdellovibrionaceae bacterium]|nr:DUF4340 domain-containing protein [Bdellovibrionales bacterium]MCB9085847.1 DUF4340 domain-containing protein [Pseudobdellovibrionaceae bacterium]